MTLHETRHRSAMAAACGALSLSLTISCTGNIIGVSGTEGSRTRPSPSDQEPGVGPDDSTPPTDPGILPLPPGGAACETKQFTPARVWRLSDDQYVAAVRDLLPGVTVPTILTPGHSGQQFIEFAELFEIGPATTSDIRGSVSAVAADAVKNVAGLLGCRAAEEASACAARFIKGFATRAFRRPLEDDETSGLLSLYAIGAMVNQAEGIRMVLSAVLQSASFLYRTELGKATTVAPGKTVELTTHELASALSFLLLDSIPDAQLRAAADEGSLAQAETFKAELDRLLRLPRVQQHLGAVYQKWIGLGLGINADLAGQEAELTPELKASLEQEPRLFFADLLGKGGSITDLLTSNKGFVDRTLATHLGVPAPAGGGFGPVTYPASQRSGVLTLGGVIARYSLGHAEVFRGKFVRDGFLCEEIPPPPNLPAIEEETKASENLPTREQSRRRLASNVCGSCHAMMDPVGLTFLNYDALGRFRSRDDNGAIDASGELTGAGDVDGPVKNVVELGQKLAKSAVVRGCIESQMFGFALGRLTETFDVCEQQKIDSFVLAGGGKLSALMAGIVYSSAFRLRTGGN
jgi:hypothetical protein